MSNPGGRSGDPEPVSQGAARPDLTSTVVAMPRRPGFGREGQSIALLANHFNVNQNSLPTFVLRYQVDTASPPRPSRRGEEAPRQAAATSPRPLPKPLCRCVARVASADKAVVALRRLT